MQCLPARIRVESFVFCFVLSVQYVYTTLYVSEIMHFKRYCLDMDIVLDVGVRVSATALILAPTMTPRDNSLFK